MKGLSDTGLYRFRGKKIRVWVKTLFTSLRFFKIFYFEKKKICEYPLRKRLKKGYNCLESLS